MTGVQAETLGPYTGSVISVDRTTEVPVSPPRVPRTYQAAVQRRDAALPTWTQARQVASRTRGDLQNITAELVRQRQRYQQAQRDATKARDLTDDLVRSLYIGTPNPDLFTIQEVLTGGDLLASVTTGAHLRQILTSQAGDLEQARLTLHTEHERLTGDLAQYATTTATLAHAVTVASVARRELDTVEAFIDKVSHPTPRRGPQRLITGKRCPHKAPAGSVRVDMDPHQLCVDSVRQAATPAAALAIIEAFRHLGTDYACDGVGRMDPDRFDCSSFVSRAYANGAGIPIATDTYAPSTRSMMPWDGYARNPWFAYVAPGKGRPGDLVLQRTCTQEPCTSQHVVMLLANGTQIHTGTCGDVANIRTFAGYDDPSYVVTRRIFTPGTYDSSGEPDIGILLETPLSTSGTADGVGPPRG